jgi:hypothetical protein
MDKAMIDSARSMLDKLETPRLVLTKWEEEFIANVGEQLGEKRWISERQYEILEKIYVEKS